MSCFSDTGARKSRSVSSAGAEIVVGAERGEALAHVRFVGGRLLLVMLLHLGVDQVHQRLLVILEHVEHLVLVLQVGAQVGHDLPGQLVEQLGVIVVGDVVEIDEPAHQVVLRLLLGDDTGPAHQAVLFAAVQLLDEDLVVHGLKSPGQVHLELAVAPRHVAHGLDRDPGNVDGQLVTERDGLGHDLVDVHLLHDVLDLPLGRSDELLDPLDDLPLDFGLGEVGRARQALELPADDLERGLRRLPLLGRFEEKTVALPTRCVRGRGASAMRLTISGSTTTTLDRSS